MQTPRNRRAEYGKEQRQRGFLPDFRNAIKPRGIRREIGLRLEAAAAQVGLGRSRVPLRCDLFGLPARPGEQMQLL